MESYLALRQQLKQSIRAKMQRDSGVATASIGGDSHNNYACFFGPSETVFTGDAVKGISNLCSKFNTGNDFKKNYAAVKPTVTMDAAAMRKEKVQHLKKSRDYSFLSSSFEGEICSTTTTPPPKKDCKRRLILRLPAKYFMKGGSEMTEKKNPTKSMEKGGNGQKSNSSRANKESKKSSVSKQRRRPEQKKKEEGEGEGQKRKLVEKREREEDKQPEKKKEEGEGKERRPVEKSNIRNEDLASKLIREMFGYDPTAFSDDDDEEEDLKMEATFADIQKEERRSAKIATMEDREERRKLETERRKKRKLINMVE